MVRYSNQRLIKVLYTGSNPVVGIFLLVIKIKMESPRPLLAEEENIELNQIKI